MAWVVLRVLRAPTKRVSTRVQVAPRAHTLPCPHYQTVCYVEAENIKPSSAKRIVSLALRTNSLAMGFQAVYRAALADITMRALIA